MNRQFNRLKPSHEHRLSGTVIDRTRPIAFRLNGYRIEGFAGDTVLSAAMANGFAAVGTYGGSAIALSERFAPTVAPASLAGNPGHALPMQRTPALDGQDLVSIGLGRQRRTVVNRLASQVFRRAPYGFDMRLGVSRSLSGPWLNSPPSEQIECDLIVVGGGVAGMTAAVAAARSGVRVALVEQRPQLGGIALLFGAVENEEAPEDCIARLRAEIAGLDAVSVYTASEAYGFEDQVLHVHRVECRDALAHASVIALKAPRMILATGTVERLPVMPGNRLPGVCSSSEAFHLAHAYGVWPGRTAAIATTTNPAYRVAMLASAAGIEIRKIVDARPDPRSRFLEFCKAYGINMAGGVFPLSVHASRELKRGLTVELGVRLDNFEREADPITVHRLVCSGGWQPDLALWHMAGGDSVWQGEHNRIVPRGRLENIAVAGAAAGYLSTNACIQSGRQAVDDLFGRQGAGVVETVIDEVYETPDGPTLIADAGHALSQTTFLDHGPSLVTRPRLDAQTLSARLRRLGRRDSWRFADQPRVLGIADIAAAVQLGVVPTVQAGGVARERAVHAGDIIAAARYAEDAPAHAIDPAEIPAFLTHRLGVGAELWEIEAMEARRIEPGCPIYPNADISDPLRAIGVVANAIDDGPGRAVALLERQRGSSGLGLILRDLGRAVPIRVLRPLKPSGTHNRSDKKARANVPDRSGA